MVTNPENALRTLNSLCVEMDQRYDLLKSAGEALAPVNAVPLYKQVVEAVMRDNILVPVCQTQNAILWRTGRLKEESVPENMACFWNWTDEVETLRLN